MVGLRRISLGARTLAVGFLIGTTCALAAHHAQAVDIQCGPDVIDEPSDLQDAVTAFVSGGTCTVISLESDITLDEPLNLFVIDESDQIQPVGRSLTIEGNGFVLSGIGATSGLRVYLYDPLGPTTLTIRHLALTNFAGSGALSVISDATVIERSRFTNNRFETSAPLPNFEQPSAGAVNALGRLTVQDSEFDDNRGTEGGAIFNAVRLVELELANGASPPLVISGSTFAANDARAVGGAISATQSLTMSNSTLTGNTAGSAGGINVAGSVSLDFCTIVGNTSSSNRAAVSASGTITITNSIVSHNPYGPTSPSGEFKDVDGDGMVTITSSLVTSSDSITSTLFATALDGSNIVGRDPLLEDLGDHGGFALPGRTSIRTRPPQAGSPVIDTIDLVAVGRAAISVDQRGAGFPRVVNGRADMGAVEFHPATVPDLPNVPPSSNPGVLEEPDWNPFTWPTSLPDTI